MESVLPPILDGDRQRKIDRNVEYHKKTFCVFETNFSHCSHIYVMYSRQHVVVGVEGGGGVWVLIRIKIFCAVLWIGKDRILIQLSISMTIRIRILP
jgi:hypothetical protein